MDNFKMPMREIYRNYTISELSILGWESNNKAYSMQKSIKSRPKLEGENRVSRSEIEETETAYRVPEDVNNGVSIPKKLVNKEGELDLRQATGEQAFKYLSAIGIKIMKI